MPKRENTPTTYGTDYPHPLSHMKTELIWDGKYDKDGNRVAPLRVATIFFK